MNIFGAVVLTCQKPNYLELWKC